MELIGIITAGEELASEGPDDMNASHSLQLLHSSQDPHVPSSKGIGDEYRSDAVRTNR